MNLNPGRFCKTSYAMGYHSHIVAGVPAQPTRELLIEAMVIFSEENKGGFSVGTKAIEKVLDSQVMQPNHPYCGVWPWYLDEPVSEMEPPDRNWADFISILLLEILQTSKHLLDQTLVDRIANALELAAEQIVKRNVGAEYTNICAMGAVATAATGQYLNREDLLNYGRTRLKKLYRRMAGFDVFDEFNSPAYTPILIEELDRFQRLVSDASCAAIAERLKQIAFRSLARHLHQPTGEWTGPFARAYFDRCRTAQCRFLESLKTRPEFISQQESLRRTDQKQFSERVPDGRQLTTVYVDDLAVGTINHASMWKQCRPIIAHWPGSNQTSVFRMRVMANGHDFAPAEYQSHMLDNRLLASVSFAKRRGFRHVSLDPPADGLYRIEDLRIRLEISGDSVSLSTNQASSGTLCATGYQIDFQCLTVNGHNPALQCGASTLPPLPTEEGSDWFPRCEGQGEETPETQWIDLVLYQGAFKEFSIESLNQFKIGIALQINCCKPEMTVLPPELHWSPGEFTANHSRLKLRVPDEPIENNFPIDMSWRDKQWLRRPSLWANRMLSRAIAKSRLFDNLDYRRRTLIDAARYGITSHA